MASVDPHDLISDTLYYELRCLLGSATLWDVWRKKPNSGYDVVVAMDSALVHARCLFEVMTKAAKSQHDVSITELEVPARTSALYSRDSSWREPLNRHVMHASPGRSTPSNVIDGRHLNEMVINFALEVLTLWRQVESDIGDDDLRDLLAEKREQAIADAANDAERHGAQPVFTVEDRL